MKSPTDTTGNIDGAVVDGFGDEWTRFDQSGLNEDELREIFSQYFSIFPWSALALDATGFDLGCGSGRWARFASERVGRIICIDPSEQALAVAARNLADFTLTEFVCGSAGALPFASNMFDFGYSLGVLHHTPNPLAGLIDGVRLLKPDAPFLLYLYYALDNRPTWFRAIWRVSDLPRRGISRLPAAARSSVCLAIAAAVYYPLARVARFAERRGVSVGPIPLSDYRNRSFYVMRNDALDRFGTRLEHRFTRDQIIAMMTTAGLDRIVVSESMPFWTAVGFKSASGAGDSAQAQPL